jgi:hypothetical protein
MIRAEDFRIETGRYRPVRIDIAGLHGLEIARPGGLAASREDHVLLFSACRIRPLENQERSHEGP